LPFPGIAVRAVMLEETLEILRGLWEEDDGWSYAGQHWRVEGARFRAKPSSIPARTARGERRPRIIIGGSGTPRSLRIAARFADEFNISSANIDKVAETYRRLDVELRAVGRDPKSVVHSAMIGTLIGKDEDEVARRERGLLDAFGVAEAGEEWFEERRVRWIHGTPDAARATIRRFADAGVERIMLQDFVPRDLEMIDLMGEELIGKV
jgi:alkanesulfonate monooxygenase SsuD/methylene tetrahydromethanopterin reductase-like flavin-dependent oxidoreductase (luciferase family)